MIGAYIHIPFCRQKCKYCDFNSYSGISDMSYSYVQALRREIRYFAKCNPGTTLETIYIGGGTPTYIDEQLICGIMSELGSCFVIRENAEITIECNPGTADFNKLKILRESGINRLSIGLQSASDEILKTLGRIHSYTEFLECFKSARMAGFENISVDLMFGLPMQSDEVWIDTIERVMRLMPEHISAYSLKIEEGTPFYDMYNKGCLIVPDDDQNRRMYDNAAELLKENGYVRYEISNFARRGFESRHNLLYWSCDDYIGFGAGACSCINGKRFSNEYNINEYISAVDDRGSADIKSETVINTELDFMCEFMFLGLRLDRGVSKTDFKNKFGRDVYEIFYEPLHKHINLTQTIIDDGESIKIKSEYIYVSNIIMSDFIM